MKRKAFKSLASFMLAITMVLTLALSNFTLPVSAASGGFQVSGTKLYDANGNEFIMRGVNYPHAWFTSQYTTAIPAIAAKGFNTVRIVLADGQQWSKTSYSELSALIDLCKAYNLVAVLEVHDATGSDSTYDLNQAVNYWIEMKNLLIGNEAYVIVNIANEWYGSWDNMSTWKNAYISAIQSLRNAGIKNTLMVDSAGWGQYPQSIFDYGKEILSADSQGNTMFSIHMYEYAGGSESVVKSNIDNVINQNLCLTIGEFGGYHTGGDVDEYTIMSYCQQKSVGWMAWSWTGNGSDLSYLDLCNDFSGSSLTDFGNTVIYGSNGISQTSKTCSVFTGSSSSGSSSSGSSSGSSSSSGTTNIFYGSASASNWSQAVSVSTVKNGGSANVADMGSGDYIWVEYSNSYDDFDLIFQSWSGGEGWAKISPSESGTTSSGTNYSKFYYSDIASVYGSNFSTVDVVHVSAHSGSITVKSVDIVLDGSGSSSSSSSSSSSGSSSSSSSSSGTTTNIFYGSASASNWSQAVSVSTNKSGGSVDITDMNSGDFVWVEYTGSYGELELIFQSWSGGENWAKISPSENGGTGNNTYYAKFYYDDIVNVYGSNFSTVNVIHVGAYSNSITVISVDVVK